MVKYILTKTILVDMKKKKIYNTEKRRERYMEVKPEVELERAKMRNYILEKENEILLGSIGALAKEKKQLIEEIQNLKEIQNHKDSTRDKIKKIFRGLAIKK